VLEEEVELLRTLVPLVAVAVAVEHGFTVNLRWDQELMQ
jgi:hypothetical protein